GKSNRNTRLAIGKKPSRRMPFALDPDHRRASLAGQRPQKSVHPAEAAVKTPCKGNRCRRGTRSGFNRSTVPLAIEWPIAKVANGKKPLHAEDSLRRTRPRFPFPGA